MLSFLSFLIISVIGANASGQFSILHSPNSLVFSGSGSFPQNTLKEIYSAALGLSVDENTEWTGLSITDPFSTPEALVEVYIDGITTLGDDLNLIQKYPVSIDENELDTFDAVTHRIKQRFISGGNLLMNLDLKDVEQLRKENQFEDITVNKNLKTEYLSIEDPQDLKFLSEMVVLESLASVVLQRSLQPDNVIDYIRFHVSSMHHIADTNGPNSQKMQEATKILSEAILKLKSAFVKAYEGNVLVTVVTVDAPHSRTRRSTGPMLRDKVDTSDDYSKDYAAIFNIMLWFTVVFIFSLVAIVYSIMDMDPGRDSIIYRMTSTRMKKEN